MHERTERRHTRRIKDANHLIASYRYKEPDEPEDSEPKKLPQSVKSLYTHLWSLDGHRKYRYGYLYRTIRQLEKETGMGHTTIVNAIHWLETLKVLKSKQRSIQAKPGKPFTNRITGFKLKGGCKR